MNFEVGKCVQLRTAASFINLVGLCKAFTDLRVEANHNGSEALVWQIKSGASHFKKEEKHAVPKPPRAKSDKCHKQTAICMKSPGL